MCGFIADTVYDILRVHKEWDKVTCKNCLRTNK